MRNLRQLIRRTGLLSSDKRRRRSEKLRRSDAATQRRLGSEALEKRELLAGDILAANHNYWNPYDVNDDGQITARDALGIINYMSQNGEGEAGSQGDVDLFYDVNADHNISASDALGVINAMSRGEEVGELVEILLTPRDLNDDRIQPDANGEVNVEVGQIFDLEVAYDDLRIFNSRLGVFQLFTDIAVSQPDVLMPVLNETQRLIIDTSINTVGSTAVTFSIPEAPPGVSGGALSYESPIGTFANNTIGEVTNALLAFGYESGEFTVDPLDFEGGDLGFEIHWVGVEFGNVDLPNIAVDVLESNPLDVIPTQTIEFAPFEADGVTPNSAAVRFNINSDSRTFNDGEPFYQSQNRGTFNTHELETTSVTQYTIGEEIVGATSGAIGIVTSIEVLENDPFLSDDSTTLVGYRLSTLDQFVEGEIVNGQDSSISGEVDEVSPTTPQGFTGVGGLGGVPVEGGGIPQLSDTPGEFIEPFDAYSIRVYLKSAVTDLIVSVNPGEDEEATLLYGRDDAVPQDMVLVESVNNNGNGDEQTNGTALIIINATATSPGVLSIDPASVSVDEDAGNVQLTVNRTEGSTGSVTVDFATANGSALAGSDYTGVSSQLTFADGEVSKTITVPITDDSDTEEDETFTVSLNSPTNGATLGTAVSTVTIVDNDAAQPGVLAFDMATATVDEDAGTVTLTVNRTGGSDGIVTVDFASADVSATAGADYVATSDTLTFADGEASKTITVAITDDTDDEPDETFTVTLSNATGGATLGANTVSTVTITDNDEPPQPGTLAIDPTSISVNEADGTVSLTINRTDGDDGVVGVTYATADDTATAGADYTAASEDLSFADGETSKTITIAIINDTDDESSETFTVTLSNATGGASLGAATQAVVTIVDDDNPVQPGVLAISPVENSVNEDAGTVTYLVTRTGGSDGAVTVEFATADDTATAGADYTANSGTLDFADGENSKTISVAIIDDADDEGNELFTVTLSNATGGATLGNDTVSTTTIVDNDDPAMPGELNISPGSITVDEDAGTVGFIISRTGGSDGEVTVEYATGDGSATAGEDYTADSGTVTFADGELTKTISVSIIDDSDDESDEDFTVTLSNATGGATLGSGVVSTVTISDNDETPVPGTLSIVPNSVDVNENAGTVTFEVARTGGSDGIVSVQFATADGTATAGSDYVADSGTLVFGDGEISKSITISITNDIIDEPDETFDVSLSAATGGASIGNASATVTILDNDLPGNIPPSTITGSVFIDHVENLQQVINGADPIRNGLKEDDEEGLGGVIVRLVSAADENATGEAILRSTLTNLDGRYTFDELGPGTYHVVYDEPTTVIFVGENDVERTIPDVGGIDIDLVNFALLGTQGSALHSVDILASSYLRTNATMNQISDEGREGGLVSFDENGNQEFVIAYAGYDDVSFAELALSNDRDSALLTIIEEDGDVLTALLSSDQFVVTDDGRGVQFFGGMNDLNFVDADEVLGGGSDFPTYRDAIDEVLGL